MASMNIRMRYATDAGEPQFDDPQAPNYVTATASNGARLALRYDVKDQCASLGQDLLNAEKKLDSMPRVS
jgi:hypothetical protein